MLPVDGVPGVRDPLTGDRSERPGYTRDQATGRVRATAPLTGRPTIVDFNEGATDVVAQRTGVSAERRAYDRRDHRAPSAAAARAGCAGRQLHRARADGAAFPADGHRPGLRRRDGESLFRRRRGAEVEWEELSFSVNGSKWGADRPAFPLLQPEKVLSLPLQLRFDEGYRVAPVEGTRARGRFDCFVVRFDPVCASRMRSRAFTVARNSC